MFVVLVAIAVFTSKSSAALVGDSKYELQWFNNQSYTFTNFKFRLTHRPTGKQWDFANRALSATPTFANTCQEVTLGQNSGSFDIDFDVLLPAGEYNLVVLDSASPAYTDPIVGGLRIQWNGKEIVGLPVSF